MDVSSLSLKALLELQGHIMLELHGRGVGMSSNPTRELARHLFIRAFGWTAHPSTSSGPDAVSAKGSRIKIKGRRMLDPSDSLQMTALPDPATWSFEWLAAVVFDWNYDVVRAAVIPVSHVGAVADHDDSTGERRFTFDVDTLCVPGIYDATARLGTTLGAVREVGPARLPERVHRPRRRRLRRPVASDSLVE